MEITENMKERWNADATYISGETMDIHGRGRMPVVRGIETMTLYVRIDGQRWPVICDNVALCDGERYGLTLTPDGLAGTLRSKRVQFPARK